MIPAHAAAAIAEACRAELFDVAALAEAGRSTGNPAEPLVRALRELVGAGAADYVHFGATSQDILDSAAMIVTRTTLGLIIVELDGLAAACARLSEAHRGTPMAARTLLQQAVPTSFGLKAAGWLVAVVAARRRLVTLAQRGLASQLGGAAGTLAALGAAGPAVAEQYAIELDLPQAVLPWHAERTRVAELGAALAVTASAVAKIGPDVALLAQTEVAEVAEPAGGGASSTMPQKRNPVGSALAIACARDVRARAAVLIESVVQEHERALGGWHAEWGALSAALASTGGAVAAIRSVLEPLEIDGERMRENLRLGGGGIMSERVSFALAASAWACRRPCRLGRRWRRDGRRTAAVRFARSSAPTPRSASPGSAEDDEIFDSGISTYLGAASRSFAERALAFGLEEADDEPRQ